MKRGQTTIFIILGVVILVGIGILIFLFSDRSQVIRIGGGVQEENTENFMELCLEEDFRENLELILLQGGYIKNKLNVSFKLEEETEPIDISYLCYSRENIFPCANQEPMLFQHIEKEIEEAMEENVERCFNDLVSGLERSGYLVNERDYLGFEVNLEPERIRLDLDAELSVSKTNQTSRYENFEIFIGTKTYDILDAVNHIVNIESTSCRFDEASYMNINPEFRIERYLTRDSSEIYIVRHKETNEELRFAVRSCTTSGGMI